MNYDEFKLSGFVSEFPLFEVIQFLGMTRKKGALCISWEKEEDSVKLYIDDGQLLHAVNHKGAGADVFYRTLARETGYFRFSPHEAPDRITIDQSISFMLLESQRRLDELRNLNELLPLEDSPLFINPSLEKIPVIDPREWKTLAMVNGRRSLKGICELLGDELAVKKSVFSLIQKGLISCGPLEDAWKSLTPLLTPSRDIESERPWPPLLRTNLLLKAVDNFSKLGELQKKLNVRDNDFFADVRLLFETRWIHFSQLEEKIFSRYKSELF